MTVEIETRSVERVADGVALNWNFSFRIYSAAHLRLYTRATSDDVWSVVDSALYTVTLGAGDSLRGYAGGVITYPITPLPALAAGILLMIERVVPYTQTGIDLSNVSGFNPEALERELDLAVMRDQQTRDALTAAGFLSGPASAKVQNFTGDGSTTAFTLSVAPSNVNGVVVSIDGIHQHQSAFTVAGAVVTFSEAPPSGTLIEILSLSSTALGEADAVQVVLDSGVTVEGAIPLLPLALKLTPQDSPAAAVEGMLFYWSGSGSAPDGGVNGAGLYIRKSSAWVFIA